MQELDMIKKTAAYRLHNTENYEDNFAKFLTAAEDLAGVSPLSETLTAGNMHYCKTCEACNTAGLILKRAGISVKEFHDYLETR